LASGIQTFDGIQHCKNLQILRLSNLKVCDLGPLIECPALSDIQFGESPDLDLTTLSKMEQILDLTLTECSIRDLTPLAGLKSLESLDVEGNQVIDLAPLARLAGLRMLSVTKNQIRSLEPIRGSTNLTGLIIQDNQIEDLSPILILKELNQVWLQRNPIKDYSQLLGLRGSAEVEVALDSHQWNAPVFQDVKKELSEPPLQCPQGPPQQDYQSMHRRTLCKRKREHPGPRPHRISDRLQRLWRPELSLHRTVDTVQFHHSSASPSRLKIGLKILLIWPVCGDHMAYASAGIECRHHMQWVITHASDQAAGKWAIHRIDLDNLSRQDSVNHFRTGDAPFQKTLQCVLMPLDTSLSSSQTSLVDKLAVSPLLHRVLLKKSSVQRSGSCLSTAIHRSGCEGIERFLPHLAYK
jgi:hypothetical protein